jgi:murein DD-endopeptidase MepM/ murein hydrolase activator NlpD
VALLRTQLGVALGSTLLALVASTGLAIPASAAPTPAPAQTAAPADEPALVKERAAQRDEELAKTAEDITRAAQEASTTARDAGLTEAQRARQDEAVRIAEENRRLATAAREAAANVPAGETPATDPATPAPVAPSTNPTLPTPPSVTMDGVGVSPVPGAVIGAHFGQYGSWSSYHTGIDFRARTGTPIRAVKAGVVLFAGNSGDWAGNHVAVLHGDGMTTMSSHMSAMAVSTGQTVAAGQILGYVGQTGRAFGAHLHFELYPAGVKYGDVYRAVNPQPWLATNGVNAR